MNKIIGLLLIAVALVLGLYVGFWLMFIGGIVQIVDAINVAMTTETGVEAMQIAIGAVKIIFASAVGWFAAIVPFAIGASLLE